MVTLFSGIAPFPGMHLAMSIGRSLNNVLAACAAKYDRVRLLRSGGKRMARRPTLYHDTVACLFVWRLYWRVIAPPGACGAHRCATTCLHQIQKRSGPTARGGNQAISRGGAPP